MISSRSSTTPRKVGWIKLQPGKCVVVANAEVAESQRADKSLGVRDLPELLDRDRRSMGEAR